MVYFESLLRRVNRSHLMKWLLRRFPSQQARGPVRVWALDRAQAPRFIWFAGSVALSYEWDSPGLNAISAHAFACCRWGSLKIFACNPGTILHWRLGNYAINRKKTSLQNYFFNFMFPLRVITSIQCIKSEISEREVIFLPYQIIFVHTVRRWKINSKLADDKLIRSYPRSILFLPSIFLLKGNIVQQ